MADGWYAVDLDGTLAEYHGWPADGSIGKPIPLMVERVKAWLAEGKDVRIFTARIWPLGTYEETETSRTEPSADGLGRGGFMIIRTGRAIQAREQCYRIEQWCAEHIGRILPITCIKDYQMVRLYDDRCVQVEENTGRLIGEMKW